ncbi:hypothetical protein V6N00_15865 [Tersicoccus sp. MR15.9]|uniref:hypothetical protein n=1 Tax=Tersicoccus mangrovi TaxID=3121635 RepID=UPI002FE60488
MTSGAGVPRGGPRPVRVLLGVLGVVQLGVGVLGLVGELGPPQLLGLLGWLAAAVALHDGVLVPLTHAVGRPLRRLTGTWRPASAVVLRGGLVVGAMVALPVPALVRAQRQSSNPTLLTGDYALAVGVVWLILAVMVAGLVLVIERRGAGARPRGDASGSGR